MHEAMDGIGIDVDDRDRVTGSVSALGPPNARLMDEQLMNWNKGYWNRGGPQSSQVSATRRAEAADYSNWAIEIDAGRIDTGMAARGYHRLTCFNFE
jgi:hypothetical protein